MLAFLNREDLPDPIPCVYSLRSELRLLKTRALVLNIGGPDRWDHARRVE